MDEISNSKYETTGEVKIEFGIKLHQIRSKITIGTTIGTIVAGTIGGWISGENNLSITGDAWVSGDARVYGDALVYGDAQVSGNAQVSGDARVSGNALVYGDARVYGNAQVSGDAQVSGNAQVSGDAQVSGNAWVYNLNSYITISPIGSKGGCLTAFTQKDNSILFNRGCFSGDEKSLRESIFKKHGTTKLAKEYNLAVDLCIARLTDN
jgi:cytoskeletal protein CcmA (bactofilin family)